MENISGQLPTQNQKGEFLTGVACLYFLCLTAYAENSISMEYLVFVKN